MTTTKSDRTSEATTRRKFLGRWESSERWRRSRRERGPGVFAAHTVAEWTAALRAQLSGLRAIYLAEVERFAEELRPRFEAGKLRANRNDSGDDEEWQGSPHQKVERLCEEHFQVESMPAEAVAALLQVSPHADATSDNWTDDSYWLAASMAWDVIGAARARHYYTPTSDEEWDPRVGDQICARCGILACYHDASGVWEQPGAHPDNGCPAFVPPEAT